MCDKSRRTSVPISLDIGTLDIGMPSWIPSHAVVALDDIERP